MRRSSQDFFKPNAFRYWIDFLSSLIPAYAFSGMFLSFPMGSWQQLICYPLALFFLYRLGSLVHEVCHLKQGEMAYFKVAWNLLAGVIMFSPSPFFTKHHRDHHSPHYYGTKEDPEYFLSMHPQNNFIGYLQLALRMLATPIVVFLRFLFVPFFWLIHSLREWTLVHASFLSMLLNPLYERKLNPLDRRNIAIVEWLCFARAVQILVVLYLGITDWTRLPLLYSLGLGVLCLNTLRLAGDHHGNSGLHAVSMSDHILDSCNYTGRDPMTALLFPFSIRYHALHHIFPSLPYHNLAAAHRYLEQELAASSPYHQLDQKGWWGVARHTLFDPHAVSRV
jgi:fatty acid desaturase